MNKEKAEWYADYDYYTEEYLGSLLTDDAFYAALVPAEAYVDALTYGRLRHGAAADDAVKKAVCAVAEAVYRSQTAQANAMQGLASANNDGVSESYCSPDDLQAWAAAEKMAAADLYLPRSHPLRYMGV